MQVLKPEAAAVLKKWLYAAEEAQNCAANAKSYLDALAAAIGFPRGVDGQMAVICGERSFLIGRKSDLPFAQEIAVASVS